MATKDISRSAFDPRKRYTGVRMQQGRVFVDDDWNENERIADEDMRRSRVSIIGPAGSPDNGFRIANPRITEDGLIDFDIHSGSFYLGGRRLEMEAGQTLRMQSDWLQLPDSRYHAPESVAERFDLVYLITYQVPVSAVEDSELFEVALGGPDTTVRMRTVQRIMLAEDVATQSCEQAWAELLDREKLILNNENEFVPEVTLTVTFAAEKTADDLCTPAAAGGYLGAENQAIRVQLVDEDHFTWGFDNASPLYRAQVAADRSTVTLLTDPKDPAHWPLSGQIVEILPWSAVLPNNEKVAEIRGHLSRVEASYQPDTGILTLETPVPGEGFDNWKSRADGATLGEPGDYNWKSRPDGTALGESGEYYYLRVWDRGSDQSSDPAIPFVDGTLGSSGLEVTIAGAGRIPGDYWIVAARPETPNRVVPWELEDGRRPHGVRRFYAPLALLHWKSGPGEDIAAGEVISDCRKTFRPLTKQIGCCTYTVGDGVRSHGHFDSIELALLKLPQQGEHGENGGIICLLPGLHRANVILKDRIDIKITGCGIHSIVVPTDGHPDRPIFRIQNSERISLDNMTLVTATGTAIELFDTTKTRPASRSILIERNLITALVHAINIRVNDRQGGNNDIRIMENEIAMLDKKEGKAAIFCLADDVAIERNRIIVVPALNPDNPDDPREPDTPENDIFDPCVEPQILYRKPYLLKRFVYGILKYMKSALILQQIAYLAQGGVQIGGGSERVRIIENRIIGGNGNGITLGHLPSMNINDSDINVTRPVSFFKSLSTNAMSNLRDKMIPVLYEISIENNLIQNMGLCGIGVPAFFKTEKVPFMFSVEDLAIYRNRIERCAHLIPDDALEDMPYEVGFGGIVLAGCENAIIRENRIENNGTSQHEPVCGILILYGEKIDVSDNRILNNGPRTSTRNDNEVKAGLRGGIVITMSFRQIQNAILDKEVLLPDGVPAVKIHDNVVTQPLGQSLFIRAFGPVSAIGNHLTSQGADFRVNPFSLIAGSVFILNLGASKDSMVNMHLDFRYMAAVPKGATAVRNAKSVPRILHLPSGNVLFTNNQTTLDLRHEDIDFSFSSQAIVSLDDIAYNSNQSECTSLVDYLYTDVALFGVSIRANDNRFQEGMTLGLPEAFIPEGMPAALNSLFSFGFINMAMTNQSTHCLQVFGSMLVPSPPLQIHQFNSILDSSNCPNRLDQIARLLAVAPGKFAAYRS